MKEFKGTKGKWRVKHDTSHIECNGEIISIGGYLRVYDETQLDGESWLDMRSRTAKDRQDIVDEAIHNAHLIAAAPDLLENLLRIIDRIEECDFQGSFPSAYARAKESINKALK